MKRQLRSGPIYTPEGFVAAIRAAKKGGEPFHVSELCYEDFYDLKQLVSAIGPINLTPVKLTDIRVVKVQSDSPYSIFYKTSYSEEFKELTVIKKKKTVENLPLKPAFCAKPGIPPKKKEDLLYLVRKNYIPKVYEYFYMNL